MASRYAEEIRSLQPSGPYLIAGFCAGGTIAYEMFTGVGSRVTRVYYPPGS